MLVTAADDTPLLWVLRDHLGVTSTKFRCGMGLCGDCTVHMNGHSTRACLTPLSMVSGKKITTIEGVGTTPIGKSVQEAWLALNLPLALQEPQRRHTEPSCGSRHEVPRNSI
jgi:isoquinoline 1-oxidoreductase alpha subunit